jgi:phosphoesterase RecJ-like protein
MTEENKKVDEIVEILKNQNMFFILSHVDPDGDAIGSLLALSLGLLRIGKHVWPFIHKPLRLPYVGLDADKILRLELPKVLDEYVCVALDCTSENRLGEVSKHLHSFKKVINIDHHKTNTLFGHVNWVDPEASCVGEMLFWILKGLGIPFDKDMWGNIYYAIQTDTGGFRFDNTSKRALAIAHCLVEEGVVPWEVFSKTSNARKVEAFKLLCEGIKQLEFYNGGSVCLVVFFKEDFEGCHAELEDSEDMIELFRELHGVQVMVLAREIRAGRFKFSLRSKAGLDVSQIALRYGGGGHRSAAGFELAGDWEEIKTEVIQGLLAQMGDGVH